MAENTIAADLTSSLPAGSNGRSTADAGSPDQSVVQLDTLVWLRGLHDAGELDGYAGQFVIAYRGKLYGHGPDLSALRAELEPGLLRDGVPADRWVEYYVA